MRQARRKNQSRQAVARPDVFPAPTKGWSASTTPLEAEEGTAILLDNWFPEATSIRPRKGYAAHVTGVANEVQTLMSYVSGSTKKLFACGDGKVYDVTSAGALGVAAISSLTSTKMKYINFATPSTQYLYWVNGADAPRMFDGSSWSTPTITGATAADFSDIMSHKSRIWFIKKNSTTLYYLPVDAIQGAATAFEVGSQLRFGGKLVAMMNWSIDAGDGPDDVLAIWSSEGELLVYAGSNPSSDYSIIGRYKTAKPIGDRCVHPIGGDVAMISEDGILALSSLMRSERVAAKEKALTSGVVDEYLRMIDRSRNLFGWQIVVYPQASMGILNIPGASEDGKSWQFVFNVTTKAWCRFKGWDAICWVYHDDKIFFGTKGGGIYQAETGASDNGAAINLVCLPAFSQMKRPGVVKHVKEIQALYATDTPGIGIGVACAINFREPTGVSVSAQGVSGLFTWDTSYWDGSDVWGGLAPYDPWIGAGNIGYAISPYTIASIATTNVTDLTFSLIGWHILYEGGGLAYTA